MISGASAHAADCPVPGQQPMTIVHLLFGRGAPVTDAQWKTFIDNEVTPRFPDGLTTYTGYGQWKNPKTGKITKEQSSVIMIATMPAPDLPAKLLQIRETYKAQFKQESVGIVTDTGCASF